MNTRLFFYKIYERDTNGLDILNMLSNKKDNLDYGFIDKDKLVKFIDDELLPMDNLVYVSASPILSRMINDNDVYTKITKDELYTIITNVCFAIKCARIETDYNNVDFGDCNETLNDIYIELSNLYDKMDWDNECLYVYKLCS